MRKRRDLVSIVAGRVGQHIADHPWRCILSSLIVVTVLSIGLLKLKLETDIRKSFSPRNSDTSREVAAYLDFYNLTQFPQRSFIHFSAYDGGDMLREECLREVEEMDAKIVRILERKDPSGKRLCDPLCMMNAPLHYFIDELRKERRGEGGGRTFAHPTSRFNGMNLFIGSSFFGVEQDETTNSSMRIKSVRSIVTYYFGTAESQDDITTYKKMSTDFFEVAKHRRPGQLVQVDIFGDSIANHEMIRGAVEATRSMLVGFALLVAFVCLVLIQDWPLRQLPILTASALFTPLLATSSAFGLLSWLEFNTYSIECVVPFLGLGIGVDDAFILFHWWHKLDHISDTREKSRQVFSLISASITITSATNIIAFGIGYLTPTPQMAVFCLATSLSLFFDYILTYSILGPVVVLLSPTYTPAACEPQEEEKAAVIIDEKPPIETPPFSVRLISQYASFVTSVTGHLVCLASLLMLFAVCTLGVLQMRASFEPGKAFPSDSPLATSLQRIKPVFNETFPLSIYVHNPPQISNEKEYTEFKTMLDQLESIPGVNGRERTVLFLKEYEEFDRKFHSISRSLFFLDDSGYTPSLHNLPTFLNAIDNPITIQYTPANETGGEARLTRFLMAVTAKGMAEWARRAELVDEARKILQQYPSLNATIFDGDSAVLSLLLTVGQDLIGSILVTVISMAVIVWFFIWNVHAVIIISCIITSICYCLVGVLSLWGSDLDPVTQVDVLLATGFSVDYTAHIAFQFCRATGSPKERVTSALEEMSAPLLQAGISTLLCMLPLIFIKTYAILTFAKTVFAVIFLGLFHGLFVLPVFLSIYPPKSLAQ